MNRLPVSRARLLALTLFFLVVGGLLMALVGPLWSTYRDNREQVLQLRDHKLRYQRLASSIEPLKAQLQQMQGQNLLARYALPQESPGLAAARLQKRVKTMVAAAGGQLLSTQNLPPEQAGSFQRVTVNVKMRGSTEVLADVLYRLESAAPLLFVDNLLVTSRVTRARRSKTAGRSVLEVRFDLSGYVPGGEG